MTDAFSLSSGSAFCTVKTTPFDVRGERGVELFFGDVAECLGDAATGVRHQDVDAAPAFANNVVHVQVGEVGRVRADGFDLSLDLGHRRVEHTLPSAANEDVRAVGGEPLGDGKPDTGRPTGDDGCLALQRGAHEIPLASLGYGPKSQ